MSVEFRTGLTCGFMAGLTVCLLIVCVVWFFREPPKVRADPGEARPVTTQAEFFAEMERLAGARGIRK